MMSLKVTIRKFKMLYFRNEKRHRTGNLQKDLFPGHLQPPLDKNSEDHVILINLVLFSSSLECGPEEEIQFSVSI